MPASPQHTNQLRFWKLCSRNILLKTHKNSTSSFVFSLLFEVCHLHGRYENTSAREVRFTRMYQYIVALCMFSVFGNRHGLIRDNVRVANSFVHLSTDRPSDNAAEHAQCILIRYTFSLLCWPEVRAFVYEHEPRTKSHHFAIRWAEQHPCHRPWTSGTELHKSLQWHFSRLSLDQKSTEQSSFDSCLLASPRTCAPQHHHFIHVPSTQTATPDRNQEWHRSSLHLGRFTVLRGLSAHLECITYCWIILFLKTWITLSRQ